MKVPCRGCTGRYVGCHAECNEYKQYRMEVDAARDERNKEIPIKSLSIDRSTKAKRRWQK